MLILIILVLLIIAAFIYYCFDWSAISYSVDKNSNKESEFVSFDEFFEMFKQIKWSEEYCHGCYTDESTDCEIWCSTYKINGKHYMLKNYIEWLKWKKFYHGTMKYNGYIVKKKDYKTQILEENKQRDIITSRLTSALTEMCNQLAIPLYYREELGDAAGHIIYKKLNDQVILNDAVIEIRNSYKDTPWVLAHELGHYLDLMQHGDTTEEGADREALKFCKSILTEQEAQIVSISLNTFFGNKLERCTYEQ